MTRGLAERGFTSLGGNCPLDVRAAQLKDAGNPGIELQRNRR